MQWKSGVLRLVGGATLFLAAGSLIAQGRLAAPVAAPYYTPTYSFGMIGLGSSAVARLNVVNLVRTPPPIMAAIAQLQCKVELDVYDGQGKLVKQKTIPNLGYGQADVLDVARSDVETTGTHVDISAVVRVGSNQAYFCCVSPTLEVYDSVTGNTTAILPGTTTSPAFFWPP
jgi:hypothetical protein